MNNLTGRFSPTTQHSATDPRSAGEMAEPSARPHFRPAELMDEDTEVAIELEFEDWEERTGGS